MGSSDKCQERQNILSRARVQITNLPGLRKQACECYGIVKNHYDRLLNIAALGHLDLGSSVLPGEEPFRSPGAWQHAAVVHRFSVSDADGVQALSATFRARASSEMIKI